MTNRIEKTIELKAPVDRVWRALSDYREFGSWFKVAIEGPFAVGETARGRIMSRGFEHVVWEVVVTAMDAPRQFAFTWHPYAVDPDRDYAGETPTLVEFTLAPLGSGTRLTVVESGFDALPADRLPDALRMNDGGWTQQMKNIAAHVGG